MKRFFDWLKSLFSTRYQRERDRIKKAIDDNVTATRKAIERGIGGDTEPDEEAPTDTPGNAAVPPSADPYASHPQSQSFLWKPVSNTGNLCVLLPGRIRKPMLGFVVISRDAAGADVIARPGKIYIPEKGGKPTNGNRLHCRYPKPGGAYDDVYHVTRWSGGPDHVVKIRDGSDRQ